MAKATFPDDHFDPEQYRTPDGGTRGECNQAAHQTPEGRLLPGLPGKDRASCR